MGDGLARVLSKSDFDAESFVKKQLNCSVLNNSDELESLRRQVGTLKWETSAALKKNVYKHYSQFIETAKEISILEGEMYEMTHLLTEQKNVINTVTELSLTDHTDLSKETAQKDELSDFSSRVSLSFLLERVQGCCPLNKASTRQLIYDGDLVELDADSHLPLSRVHLFLLSDSLLVASCLPEIKGTFQYKFEALYDLCDMAVVSVRETVGVSCAFKVLVFPASRLFCASSAKLKKKWIDVLDEWKKMKAPMNEIGTNQAKLGTNPFEKSSVVRGEGGREELEGVMEEWVGDAPEDLDVLVAQRDFEGSVDLVIKVNTYLEEHPSLSSLSDFKLRLEHRVTKLTEAMVAELSVSAERSIRGGLRGLRKVACQLVRLKKTTMACELLLANRSRVCHHVLKQLSNESQAFAYVSSLCQCFFGNMVEISEEFKLVFAGSVKCYSIFILWCHSELQYFSEIFHKQVFDSNISFNTIVSCVAEAKKECRKLGDCGVDMLFQLEDLMQHELLASIQAAGDTQMEAVKHRVVDDKWMPVNLQTKESLGRFVEEMKAVGFEGVSEFNMDDTHTYLTTTTIEFAKSYRQFSSNLFSLHCTQLHSCIVEGLKDILVSYASYLFKASTNPKLKDDLPLIRQNSVFVGREVVGWVIGHFQTTARSPLQQLISLQNQLLEI